jgi:sugar phosphate isomerase/epimerase
MSGRPVDRRRFLKQASALAASAAVFGRTPATELAAGDGAQRGSASASATAPARPQFSLAHLTVLGCAPPEVTYIAARAGYDFVSFRLIPMGVAGEATFDITNKETLRQTKAALASTGLTLHDIEVARISDGLDPRRFLPGMEAGAELGAIRVITNNWATDRSFALDCYGQLCDMARPLGLTMDVEFVTFASGCKTLSDAVAFVGDAKRSNCGILVDTLHFSRSRVTLAELDRIPREWIHFVHICDAPADIPATDEGLIKTAREERLYPGEGAIDIAAVVNRLPPVPYSIEVAHLARVKEIGYAEHAFRCLEAARKYLAAHPRAAR